MILSGEYINNNDGIKSFLLENGFKVEDHGNYIKCNNLLRGGNDINSISIYPNKQIVLEHVLGEKYSLKNFFSKILNIDETSVEEKLKGRDINLTSISQPKIEQPRIFSTDILKELIPIYDYWINRGISEDVLRETKGGIYSLKGSLKNRFVFPIFNSKNQIVGLTGRDTTGKSEVKWIHKGQKSNWVYPAFINHKDIIKNKSVFLLESPGDCLSLMTCGIRNNLVLFGTEINLSVINYLLKINIDKIYISLNDDSKTNNAGNNATEKIYKKLNKYFSNSQIKISMVKNYNDWNECLVKAGRDELLTQLKKYLN